MATNDTKAYINSVLAVDAAQLLTLQTVRNYAEGVQLDMVTDEQLELLGETYNRTYHPQLNICSTIVEVESDRLNVLGLDIELPPDTPDSDGILASDLKNITDNIWNLSQMDLTATAMHYSALRDGDGYLIVGWDNGKQAPRLCFNAAYDGKEGCAVVYGEATNRESALYAFKVWDTIGYWQGFRVRIKRLNVYWHNRIEYYVQDSKSKQWLPYAMQGDGEYRRATEPYTLPSPFDTAKTYQAEVQWLTHDGTANGIPLGLPVFHYPHNARGMATGVSSIRDVAPALQDDINAAHINVILAQQLMGAGMYWATGFTPPNNTGTTTASGKVTIEMYPGAILHTPNVDAAFGRLEGGDIAQLIEGKNDLIKNAATITSTPLTFFNITGQIPAEGTLQSLQESLLAKVKRDQQGLGVVYAAAVQYALIYEWAFGVINQDAITLETLQSLEITTLWENPMPQSKSITIKEALDKQQLGIPQKQLWLEMGYTTDQVEEFEQDAALKRAQVLGAINLATSNIPPMPPDSGVIPSANMNGSRQMVVQ